MLTFEDLPEEVILLIFTLCDIYTVISSTQTNRYLHRMALERSIWVELVQALRLRGFIDRLSATEIRASSTATLIGVVKRITTGQETWPREHGSRTGIRRKVGSWMSRVPLISQPRSPQMSAQINIHPIVTGAPTFPHWINPTRLLRGGKYIIFSSWDGVHCWQVETDTWLWSHQTSTPGSMLRSFAAEVENEGKTATVAVCFTAHTQSREKYILHIVDVDLENGITQDLVTMQFPRSNRYPRVSIGGDVAAIAVDRDREYVLVNRRTKSCLRISRRVDSAFQLKLIPGFIIFAESGVSRAQLAICAVEALSGHWQRTDDCRTIEPVPVELLPTLASHSLALPCDYSNPYSRSDPHPAKPRPRRLEIVIHDSPLQRGLYRVWVYTHWSEAADMLRQSFHLDVERNNPTLPSNLHDSTEVVLRPRGKYVTAKVEWHWEQCMWYSGHRATLVRDRYRIFPPGLGFDFRQPVVEGCHNLLDVAPYSGGIVWASDSAVVISYFR
ncbi:hypothetical protein C8R43DRAFT_1129268 [Mycena crocata]|nr:hypothetical protein C8R43DRAFT_1129268 [Mycena crocata]